MHARTGRRSSATARRPHARAPPAGGPVSGAPAARGAAASPGALGIARKARLARRGRVARRVEVERSRVDAVALPGRVGAVVEDVPEMRPAAVAYDLGPRH